MPMLHTILSINTQKKDLKESTFYDGDINTGYSMVHITILKNPLKEQLKTMIQKEEVRFIFDNNDNIYTWNASDATHFNVIKNFFNIREIKLMGIFTNDTIMISEESYSSQEDYTKEDEYFGKLYDDVKIELNSFQR